MAKKGKKRPWKKPLKQYEELELSLTLPRWVVEEIVAGMLVRADFHKRTGRPFQGLRLREYGEAMRRELETA